VAAEQEGAQPGRFRYEDVDNDDKITPEDRQFLASPHPDFTGGLTLSQSTKALIFLLSFMESMVIQYTIKQGCIQISFRMVVNNNKSRVLLNAWSPENTNSMIPRLKMYHLLVLIVLLTIMLLRMVHT
jgi:hypothetical protein